MVNTEKQEHSNKTESHSSSNRNNTHPMTEKTLMQEEKQINIETIKRMKSEKKTSLLSIWNQDWKSDQVETGNNKRIINTYLNEHSGIKLIDLCRS